MGLAPVVLEGEVGDFFAEMGGGWLSLGVSGSCEHAQQDKRDQSMFLHRLPHCSFKTLPTGILYRGRLRRGYKHK
jgi:hypothetical protein